LFGGDLAVSMGMIERSVTLNPSAAWGWSAGGWNRLWVGEPDAAISHFETALRLSPREPRRQWFLAGNTVARCRRKTVAISVFDLGHSGPFDIPE
jgi:hypothetical protein